MLERLFGKKRPKSSQPENDENPAAHTSPAEAQPDLQNLGNTSRSVSAESNQGQGNQGQGNQGQGPSPALDLERAMVANVAMDSPDTRMRVYQELLFSDLLLAVADEAEGGAGVSEGGTGDGSEKLTNGQTVDASKVRVAILKNASNIQFAVAFTSGEAASRWRPEGGQYVSIKGQEIFKLLDASPAEVIVVNPASLPFIVLPKLDYKQLALGVVPQTQHSPVQNPPPQQQQEAAASAAGEQGNETDSNQQMQIAFPPDVFDDDQKSFIKTLLLVHTQVEAAVFGALKPPGAKENEWVRTIFLRVRGVEQTQEAVQHFSNEVKQSILQNQAIFKDFGFEVGIMPDPQFWLAMHENKLVIVDKNPPSLPATPEQSEKPSGVADARTGNDSP
jgi:hypothetical protein